MASLAGAENATAAGNLVEWHSFTGDDNQNSRLSADWCWAALVQRDATSRQPTADEEDMSRYFFDLHNGDGPMPDTDGMDLCSKAQITREVARILVDIARDEMPQMDRAIISVKVRNEAGKVVSVSSLTFDTEWME